MGCQDFQLLSITKHSRLPSTQGKQEAQVETSTETRGPFLESLDNQRARKGVVVFMQDSGFNSFASNMIKLSVNETKWSSLLATTRALILYISI